MNNYKNDPNMFPLAPPGGGYLVLSKSQIGNFDLLCAIKTIYPNTRIIPQQEIIPVEARAQRSDDESR